MTLLLPNLSCLIIKTSLAGILLAGHVIKYLEQEFPIELFGWLGYILIPHVTALLQGYIGFIRGILSVPLYFWNLLWHPNGRSIYDMLCNPEGQGRFISRTDNPIRRRYRERARPVPRWVWRRKPSRLRFRWSSFSDCTNDKIPLRGYDSRLCMFSYYQIHPSSINKTDGNPSSEDGVTADTKSNTVTWTPRLASKLLSGIKIFRKARPNAPPNGLISSFLVMLSMIGIFGILVGIKCSHILNSRLILPSEGDKTFILPSEGVADCISLSSKGDDTASYTSENSERLHGFTSSFADGDTEKLNTQIHFDTDSVFFVCDNSTTGHICNDIRKFVPGTLHQTNKSLTTANGTGPCLQEGTIRLQLNDDNGMKHVFILDNCLYHPNSPVNLLSTRRLAEKFIDENGNPDEQTRIESRYSTHVLTWSFGNFKRTFPTPLSGLPELLFDEGFQAYKSFCMEVSSYAVQQSDSNAITTGNYIPFDDDELFQQTTEDEEDINMLFMANETINFKDGKGINRDVTYLGPDLSNGILKHKIRTRNGSEFLVDGILLSSLGIPDIATIPITPEQYQIDIPKLTELELMQISTPQTLDSDQREFMELHCKLSHLPFPAMIVLAEKGKIQKKYAKLKHRLPICMSCIFGKAHRKPWRSKGSKGSIRKESDDAPGKCVSMDQLVSAQPGLIPQMAGFLTNLRIWGATVFVDHFSDYVYIALMRDLTLDETLLAKTAFERHANEGGVSIASYRADNGRFADAGFQKAIKEANQSITFCAVGAHHQNGIVERRIKELTLISRTLLLHAKRHWPDYITTMMWPFALKEAAYRLNRLSLRTDGRSCEATFFNIDKELFDPTSLHVFGSPCFVLDSRLQSGIAGPPKWEPRSRLGIYVGHSPSHAGSVALVLNPRTGHVSPQYHVVFDDLFTTVACMKKSEVPPNWGELVSKSERVTDEDYDLAKTWLFPDAESGDIAMQPTKSPTVVPTDATGGTLNVPSNNPTIAQRSRYQASDFDFTRSDNVHGISNEDYIQRPFSDSVNAILPETQDDNSAPALINLETSGLRRSPRLAALQNSNTDAPAIAAYTSSTTPSASRLFSKPRPRLSFLSVFNSVGSLWTFATTTSHANYETYSFVARLSNDYNRLNGLFDDTLNDIYHQVHAFATSNETYTYSGMLKEEDHKQFFRAMEVELADHEERNHWTLMERKDLPIGTKTIMAIWSFKRKRFPDGSLNKHKARLCAHGGQQTWGLDYWDTYAPVVTWASVRLLLIVAKIHGLHSKSIDFVLAFPQADLDLPVYMELPAGVNPIDVSDENRRRYVLKLNKSLYGLKQAGYNWFEKLKEGLITRDFIQSQVDKCVFFRKDCIILTYVDDCIILGKNMSDVDAVIASLHVGPERFQLIDQGSIDKYLGLMITDIDCNTFEMSQPFLVRRILEFLSLDEHKTKGRDTPVGKPLLNRDLDGVPRKHPWLYRGAVGMLSYLGNSVRPELQMAVHQTARFSVNPMRSHELAIMRIGRYLCNNCERGVIYKVDKTKGIEVYVDADFAGGWVSADADNADNVFSRTGFVICYANCPLIWCSKLQTEIALSTAEAEYIAMSHALRDTIPIQNLVKEVSCIFQLPEPLTDFCITVHEDNLSAISMAESLKFTPRTKHIAIKYHHFRSRVQTSFNKSGDIRLKYISTKKQLADILTKPLDDDSFFKLRHMLCGW